VLVYLKECGAECDPLAILGFARRQGLVREVHRGSDGIVRANDSAALTLEEKIKKTPMADLGMATADQLAAEFREYGLKATDIAYVASRVIDSLERHVGFLRERLEGDIPGRLAVHYDATVSGRVRTKIRSLASRGRTRLIKQKGPI
jgi:hypothetical protein